MRKPFEPHIECDRTGQFAVAEPDAPATPMTRNPSTGQMEEAKASPETHISKMLLQTLREQPARTGTARPRVPEHLRRYLG